MTDSHTFYMNECYNLAKIAAERGDSPVGSLVLKNNEIIGKGIEGNHSHKDITFHAEIEAIREAVKKAGTYDLENCILYTTHEPCIMCSYVIRHAKISKIVIAEKVPLIGGATSSYPILRAADISTWGSAPEIIFLKSASI